MHPTSKYLTMSRVTPARLRRLLVRVLLGALADALLAAVCYKLRFNLATTSLLFLPAVVLQTLSGGFISSVIVSTIAANFLNYFFVPPVLTWRIADPFDFVALLAFLTTSLVIARLASKARLEAKTAERRRRTLEHLYDASQRSLVLGPEDDVPRKLLKVFREVFDLRSVCLFDGAAAESYIAGESPRLPEITRDAYFMGHDADYPLAGLSIRCLRSAGKVTGAIGFENLRDLAVTAGPLTTLAIATLERARASQAASRADAAAKADELRAAVLDALAHEFKTPLAVIATAAGGIQAVGPLTADQREMAEGIEEEASRLGHLSTRLLRQAQLDREQVKPQMELSDVAILVARIVEMYAHRYADRRIEFERGPEPAEAMVDEELLGLALSQLLDNAVKYSRPDSAILVSLHSRRESLVVRVWNSDSSVPPAERERIFERFYRGAHGRRLASGSGLGLYVARKIARAHGGALEIDRDAIAGTGTAFCLTLPLLEGEHEHAEHACQSVGR